MTKYSLLWLLLLWPGLLLAQLNITSPQSRIVYQRNLSNQANIVVSGLAPLNTTRVEARLVALPGYSGATTGWSPLSLISNNKAFRGSLNGSGGWYRLEVRAWADGNVSADGSIDRVGIGEVFIVAGQSNAFGVQEAGGASDDRVSVADFRDNDVNEQLMPIRFSHADGGGNVGPSNPLYIWGQLGDQLVRRLQVPVLFMGAAQPGTTSEQWRKTAEGDMSSSSLLLPYRRLGAVLFHYTARTGARAVLWHQGEGDVGRGQQQYFDNVQYLINKSRQQANFGALAWVVSRASYALGQSDGSVINAQNQLISNVPNVFSGPSTDGLVGPDNRADNVHFSGAGLSRLTDMWNQSLSDDFFNRSQPFSPSSDAPSITTGYVLPNSAAPGSQIWVPYVQRGPFEGGNQFKAQLLNSGGGVITESGISSQNPLLLTLPGGLPSGAYRVRVVSTQPNLTGSAGEAFQVFPGASSGNNNTPTQPSVVGGTPEASINRVGYKYDSPSHGFQLLVGATGPVEVRLERIDGGYFGETNWASAGDNGDNPGFNKARYYGPVTVGVGGVEAGRYRLSVRKAGDQGAGVWIEVNLLDGRNTVYSSTDGTQPSNNITPPVTTPPVEQPISPGFTPPTADYIGQIGYKYDLPTHGFQLLGQAQGPVQMKLERLDGAFSETHWGNATSDNGYTGYNYFRYYAPQGLGIGGVEPGRYRLSVRKLGDTGSNGQSVEVTLQNGQFQTGGGSYSPTPTNPTTPTTPVNGPGVTGGQIRKIGYKYDMPTHGFELLTEATGLVDVRLERLDGAFGLTNWGSSVVSGDYSGYNGYRRYSPVAAGVGGVEAGRYRLSARLTGDSGNGQSVEVTLGNGQSEAWTGSAGGITPATPTPSVPTPTPPTQSTQGLIQAIGYKYDLPTHGFQLLAQATTAVQMRLERLDGAFSETNWGDATADSREYNGYNYYRYYGPVQIGVGGVVAGHYRLWVRKAGDSGNGQSVDVTLQNGIIKASTPNARVATTPSPEEVVWQVYPNPAESEVTVTGSTNPTDAIRMTMSTLNGQAQPVSVYVLEPGRFRVGLGNAPTGLYLLRIMDGEKPLEVLKVLKVK
ncbi:MAG: hypothetical protein LH609_05650 [Rudanella sp.]|nr:hypothetical protein [Rudanella sp.]